MTSGGSPRTPRGTAYASRGTARATHPNFGADAGLGLVIGGDAEALSGGFGGWHVEARRARRGCLIAPQSLPEGDLIGVRLPRSVTGEPVRPGRALLSTGDGNLVTVTVPSG